MEKSLLTMTEVSQDRSHPESKVVNKAEIPVLLLKGEELKGAKEKKGLNNDHPSQGRIRGHRKWVGSPD